MLTPNCDITSGFTGKFYLPTQKGMSFCEEVKNYGYVMFETPNVKFLY